MNDQHLDLNDTIWLQQRPCGCVVAAVVAVVEGEWTLATAEQAHQHLNPTHHDLRRAADAGLQIVPVTGLQYREKFRNWWCCPEHSAAVRPVPAASEEQR